MSRIPSFSSTRFAAVFPAMIAATPLSKRLTSNCVLKSRLAASAAMPRPHYGRRRT